MMEFSLLTRGTEIEEGFWILEHPISVIERWITFLSLAFLSKLLDWRQLVKLSTAANSENALVLIQAFFVVFGLLSNL